MVLKLNELCLSFIAKEFYFIKNFDSNLLHANHKEKIIERLVNHKWLALDKNTTPSLLHSRLQLENDNLYQLKMIDYFFNGHQESLKFNDCNQVNDNLLRQISIFNKDENLNRKLFFKSLKINRCHNITGRLKKKNLLYLYFLFIC